MTYAKRSIVVDKVQLAYALEAAGLIVEQHRLGMSLSDAAEVVKVGRGHLTADAWALAESRASNIVNTKAA